MTNARGWARMLLGETGFYDPQAAAPVAASNRAGRVSLAAKVAALRSGEAYGEPIVPAQSIETHFAWVFLTDAHAYKMKKPLRTDVFDMRSLRTRRRACLQELELNRRLAPDVYLSIEPLTLESDGRLRLAGAGRVVDCLVKMRRLPTECMLDHALATGAASADQLRQVGATLAAFYRSQPALRIPPAVYIARLARQVARDAAELERAPRRRLREQASAAVRLQRRALFQLRPLLGGRARDGHIVEAHGDLRPEHVCLGEPPRIIDELEFSRELRIMDAAEELAFLSVECEVTRSAWAADVVIGAYSQASGDVIAPQLLDFYRSRRALVRARLLARRVRAANREQRAQYVGRTERYLSAAQRYALRALTPLESIHGGIASGVVAAALLQIMAQS